MWCGEGDSGWWIGRNPKEPDDGRNLAKVAAAEGYSRSAQVVGCLSSSRRTGNTKWMRRLLGSCRVIDMYDGWEITRNGA